jgi:hypothetical protein
MAAMREKAAQEAPAHVGRNVANDAAYGGGVRDRTTLPDASHQQAASSREEAVLVMTSNSTNMIDWTTPAPDYSGLTHAERYLLDVHGIVVLRGALSTSEVEAARGAVERSLQTPAPSTSSRTTIDDHVLGEPALQAITTHPRLLPVLLELMEGQPRLVGAACAVKVPDSGGLAASGRRPAGAGQIHCQREYNRRLFCRAPARPDLRRQPGGLPIFHRLSPGRWRLDHRSYVFVFAATRWTCALTQASQTASRSVRLHCYWHLLTPLAVTRSLARSLASVANCSWFPQVVFQPAASPLRTLRSSL